MASFNGTQMFIGGRFRSAANVVPVVEPATENWLGDGASATEDDIDAAVAAARAALPQWRATSSAERAQILGSFADALESRAVTTSELVSRENGIPITQSRVMNGALPAMFVRYYSQLAGTLRDHETRRNQYGHTVVQHPPIGVVAAIVPWNAPHVLAAMKFAPALAAGCTVVVKAAPETALDAVVLGEAAIEAGLPAGVFSVVPGGAGAGAHLVAHRGVDKVAFTGSSATGRSIAEVCARLLRPVTLELGGKSPAIILDDADLDATMRGLRIASWGYSGQICYLSTRVLAPRSRYQEVVEAMVALADDLTVGDPLDPSTEIGPLVSARQRERVLNYIRVGRDSGAKLVTGGAVPEDQPRGWYVTPTVFADVDNANRIAREEIFGPVLVVIPYDDDAQAVEIANDSEFGLGGTIWSTDDDRAADIARRVDTGTIGINAYQVDVAAPFGGVKASGLGRELGPEGLAEYQHLKSIYLFDRTA